MQRALTAPKNYAAHFGIVTFGGLPYIYLHGRRHNF